MFLPPHDQLLHLHLLFLSPSSLFLSSVLSLLLRLILFIFSSALNADFFLFPSHPLVPFSPSYCLMSSFSPAPLIPLFKCLFLFVLLLLSLILFFCSEYSVFSFSSPSSLLFRLHLFSPPFPLLFLLSPSLSFLSIFFPIFHVLLFPLLLHLLLLLFFLHVLYLSSSSPSSLLSPLPLPLLLILLFLFPYSSSSSSSSPFSLTFRQRVLFKPRLQRWKAAITSKMHMIINFLEFSEVCSAWGEL